jgi:hypothetical protein
MPWARLKPLNPERGIVKERYVLGGKCFQGGDGSPDRIPVWYRVSKRQAAYMATKKQKNGDPFSPDAFDIVQTAAEKDEINERENYMRMARAGLAAPPPAAMSRPREESLAGAGQRGRVTMAELADDGDDDVVAMDGRGAALAGLDTPADPVDEEIDDMVDAVRSGHEEMNQERSGAKAVMQDPDVNEEIRAEVPKFDNLEIDGEEPPPKKPRARAIAAEKAWEAELAAAAKKKEEEAAKSKPRSRRGGKTKTKGLPTGGKR